MDNTIIKFLFVTYIVVMSLIDVCAANKYGKTREVTIVILGLSYPCFVYYFWKTLELSNGEFGLPDLLFILVMLILAPVGVFHGIKHNDGS